MASKTKSISLQKYAYKNGEGFKYNCPHRYTGDNKTLVNIDWLQMAVEIKEERFAAGMTFNRGKYRWIIRPVGTKHYRYCYDVYIENTQFFTVEASPRNSKGGADNKALVKFENWLLYTDWHSVWMDFKDSQLASVDRVSRLDIAFDGMEHIYNLMNDFITDKTSNYAVKLIGKSKISAGDINRVTKRPTWYSIGSRKGQKQAVIYNKTQDIDRLGKNYIREYWQRNRISELQSKQPMYRFEIRLKSDYLKTLRGELLDVNTPDNLVDYINDSDNLIALANLASYDFFEFIYCDNKHVSRCTRVVLLPPPGRQLEKTTAKPIGTPYKAKMAIHEAFYQLCADLTEKERGTETIATYIDLYQLHDWYNHRCKDFARRYMCCDVELMTELLMMGNYTQKQADKYIRERISQISPGRKQSKQTALKLA